MLHDPTSDRPCGGARPSVARRIAMKAARSRNNPALRHCGFSLAALLLIAGGMDIVSTNIAIAAGYTEGNPIVGSLQTTLGSLWAVPKIALPIAAAYLVLWLPSRRMIRCARLVVAGYALIMVNNLWIAVPEVSAYVEWLT